MTAENAGRSIFISYRRADSEGEAGRLFDDLTRAYGEASVFMDVSGIEPGADFRKAIDSNVSGCGVLLAVIGPMWGTVTATDGSRRLDNPDDYVRLEIATALSRGIPVIPVLVHEAHMPALELLPDNLKDLRYRNSVELTHARWNSDVTLLIAALKSYVAPMQANPQETVHATVPVQLPAPQSSASAPNNPPKSKMPLYAMGGLGLAIAVGAGIFAVLRHGSGTPPAVVAQPVSQPASQPAAQPASQPATQAASGAVAQPVSETTSAAAPAPADSGPAQPKPADSAAEAPFLGRWKKTGNAGTADGLQQIAVSDFGGALMVDAWGKCGDKLCNWGPKKSMLKGSSVITGAWKPRNTPQETQEERSVKLSIQPSAAGLNVTVENTYHMTDGRAAKKMNPLQFVKMP